MRNQYTQQDVNMIITKYDHNLSVLKNAKILSESLGRSAKSLHVKMFELKKRGIITISSNKIVKTPNVQAESFMNAVLHLALARIDKEEKQKLILKLMSEI